MTRLHFALIVSRVFLAVVIAALLFMAAYTMGYRACMQQDQQQGPPCIALDGDQ